MEELLVVKEAGNELDEVDRDGFPPSMTCTPSSWEGKPLGARERIDSWIFFKKCTPIRAS